MQFKVCPHRKQVQFLFCCKILHGDKIALVRDSNPKQRVGRRAFYPLHQTPYKTLRWYLNFHLYIKFFNKYSKKAGLFDSFELNTAARGANISQNTLPTSTQFHYAHNSTQHTAPKVRNVVLKQKRSPLSIGASTKSCAQVLVRVNKLLVCRAAEK